MRIPYSWLKEWVRPLAPAEELAERLTMAGLEIEAVEMVGEETVLIGKVTPNRGDWLSIRGVAREVAAIFDAELVVPDISPPAEGDWRAEELAQVVIEDEERCPRYSARIMEGVKVGESPEWLRERLWLAGIRPINNVVDATNYVLMELGQPLHAFDLDTLAEGRIVVRGGRAGEMLTTIDGRERSVSGEDLVIADGKRAVALAGVMGGIETEVSERTRRVLLESAHFAPFAVRRTARKQGMSTEASYRFERWVDPSGTVEALDRVSGLIVESAGGEVGRGVIDVYPKPVQPAEVILRPKRANALLGVEIGRKDTVRILRGLGFGVEGRAQLKVTIPTFRNDISREEDLVEEVARLYGYERIPSAVPAGAGGLARRSEDLVMVEKAREVLSSCGLTEVVTFSLTGPEAGMGRESRGELIRLNNPLVEEFSVLRRSLLPSLLEVAGRNLGRGLRELNVFEVGKRHEQSADGRCLERWLAGMLVSGGRGREGVRDVGVDFYRMKGIVEAALEEFGIGGVEVRRAEEGFYAAGRSGAVAREGVTLAHWGEVEEGLLKRFDITQPTFYGEIDLEGVGRAWMGEGEGGGRRRAEYAPIPRYPPVRRDLAVEIPEEMTYGELEGLAKENSDELLVEINVFDVYRGEQIPKGKKSLAIRLAFQACDRTLTDEEVTERLERIARGIEEGGGISVRRAPGG